MITTTSAEAGIVGRDVGPAIAAYETERGIDRHNIGFPGATDLSYPELGPLLTRQLLNNIGDPHDPGHGANHTKRFELEVVDLIADWFHAPPTRWGYVTGGSSEGTEHALDEAWQTYPDIVVYGSAASHYSLAKAARRQKLTLVQVGTHPDGSLNLADLEDELGCVK